MNETLFSFQIKKFINCALRAFLWQKIVVGRKWAGGRGADIGASKKNVTCDFYN